MDRRRLKERGVYITVTSSTKLIFFWRKYQESFEIAEYPLHPAVYLVVVVYQVIYSIFNNYSTRARWI